MGEKVEQLKAHLARPLDLRNASAVLAWDQEVYMPVGGTQARSEQMATLQSMAHEILISEETARLLEAAEAEVEGLDYADDDASHVRIARREYDKYAKIPTSLTAEEARAISQAFVAWRQAREDDNFALFQPHLERIVDINIRKADYLGYEESPYDPLLGLFEPGMTTAEVEVLFTDLKAGLIPLTRAILEQDPPDDSFIAGPVYEDQRQWDMTMLLLSDIGYDFEKGRQDMAPHPFTISFSNDDVRVTTRILPERPQSSIFSSVHEGGHALYDQGSAPEFDRTILAGGATLGLHESQSRLWENQVGRGLPFWTHYYPIMRAFFPKQLKSVSLEQFYRAINKIEPSLIRVEADEVTYNMHIFVRFELEKDLIAGKLPVKDVPEAWNAKYEEYLGIVPPNDTLGALQDIHWSHSTLGYFPTYTLGNLISAQLYARALEEIPGLEDGFTRGEFAPLLDWLRLKVHRHGRKFTAPELVRHELGQEISAQPLLDYMRRKYTQLYQL